MAIVGLLPHEEVSSTVGAAYMRVVSSCTRAYPFCFYVHGLLVFIWTEKAAVVF